MEAENLLTLFDSYWFEQQILKKQQHPSSFESDPVQKTESFTNPALPTISTTSMDELVSFSSESSNNSVSPSSVLLPSKLQTIFSGKEVKIDATSEEQGEIKTPRSLSGGEIQKRRNYKGREHRKKKLERGFSKSLSDLEFEELKGLMDLGFVFSEEDKGSEFLSTIVPGLQLLGEEDEKEKQIGNMRRKSVNGSGISRPYLSEGWRRRKRENHPLMMSWENLPSVGNKIGMKDYLKSWAHTVASSVK